jgi:hypothetical protein
VLDDDNLGPLVLLGRKRFGDFFFVVGPLVEFAVRPLLAKVVSAVVRPRGVRKLG